MNLRGQLRRDSTTEVLNNRLDSSVIEAKHFCIKREMEKGEEDNLNMIATYTQVDSALGLHLSYLKIM